MKEKTARLREQIRDKATLEEKMSVLKGAYEGEEALILSCGPSLGHLSDEEIKELAQGRVVVGIKQAIRRAPDLTDIHLSNFVNFESYPELKNALSVYQGHHSGQRMYEEEGQFDLKLPANDIYYQASLEERLKNRLAVTRDFDAFKFEKTLVRPWGPSIILEIGLFLLIHMGVSRAVIVGWDLGFPGANRLVHYNEAEKAWLQRSADLVPRIAQKIRRKFPSGFAEYLFKKRYFLHQMFGLRRLNDGIPEDENEVLINCAPHLYVWLQKNGLEISVLSSVSHLPSEIPRFSMDRVNG